MRDIILTILVFGSLPVILMRPWVGILVWSWLSYMNPHRLTWGFAYDLPFAQIVAITLFIAVLFSREKKSFPMTGVLAIWLAFIVWMTVSTMFAMFPDSAFTELQRVLKIQLLTFVTMMVINNKRKLDAFLWTIVLSLGFYSIKGGVFTLLTGGSYRVWGPADSYIAENNALAVATLMIIPIMFYLMRISQNVWVRRFLVFGMAMTMVSILGSQSRGALLAISAVGFFFFVKSDKKALVGLFGTLVVVLALFFMPQTWTDRMDTIQNYEEDESAMGRINAWGYAINVANHRLPGAGFNSWNSTAFALYGPDPDNYRAAHSIYFGILGDHGWPGLILFLVLLGLTWRNLSKIARKSSGINKPGTDAVTLAKMLQVSLIAYMSGGAFLSLSYFDLPWHLIAISEILRRITLENNKGNVEVVTSGLAPDRRFRNDLVNQGNAGPG